MKIKIFGFTIVSTLLSIVNAKVYNFKAVSLSNNEYILGVKHDDVIDQMTPAAFPLFTAQIEADNISNYKYVVLDQTGQVVEEESIDREYSEDNSNLNEVYNRTTKQITIPELPKPFKTSYSLGSKNFVPFPNNEIWTIHAQCDEIYDEVKNTPFLEGNLRNDKESNCTLTIITAEDVYQYQGTTRLVGFGSRLYKKLSWVFKIKDDKKFFGRTALKVRSMSNDPTLMREKVLTDLYTAVGVPVQEGTYARVLINNDVWGLYEVVDTLNKKWIAAYVHNGDKKMVGTNYKLFSFHPSGPYAELKYLGDDPELYDPVNYTVDEVDSDDVEANKNSGKYYRLIQFTKKFGEWLEKYQDDSSDEAYEALEKFLDIESTLKMMVVETLSLVKDNFWVIMGNVALYYNKEKDYYQFLPYDFDDAMKGIKGPYLHDDYIQDCYTWADDVPNFEHYFTKGLLSNPRISERYNIILAKTVRDTFNLDTVSSHIDAYADLIREDVEWNFNAIDNLQTSYDGFVNHYTLNDFEDNLESGHLLVDTTIRTDDAPYGLKEFIDIRGNNCKAVTADVQIPEEDGAFSHSFSIFLLILTQILLFITLY
ncbi:hypothetical protein BCR32DRAFT_290428 [Anaeromyces robustus]|uniref:Coth-domain-containing protein n=1 Tax=Anaeromyces robustus TaxID=1754192 RepID=A0A1Y1XJD1_9FUNG|nr:hypothetical protein BCR32DRAFT_290428 [Anaeromyces robustus]|eukprot:ORX85861.1 hypothetical protein BCR32DRAFT_290428 [Anaeromyces robustus]